MAEKKKSAGGRPSSYKKEYAEQAKNLCLLGATDEFMANFFGVAVSTLNNWKLNHPEFLESLKAGKEFADAHVAQSLYKRATGYVTKETKIASFEGRITDTLDVDKHYPPDTTAAIFWLKNRRPDLWRDKPDNEQQQDVQIQKVVVEVVNASKDNGN